VEPLNAQIDPDPMDAESAAATSDAWVAATEKIGELGDVPLRITAACIGALVRFSGSLKDEDLIDAFADHYKLEVPRNLRSLVIKFAWSAKGRHFVEFDGTTWMPGDTEPQAIENFGEWTFKTAVDRAKKLLPTKPETQVYQQLLHEIYPTPSGRVPKIV